MTLRTWHVPAIAAAILAAEIALVVPVAAQGFDDRYPSDQRVRRQYQAPAQRDYFSFPFFGGDRGGPTPPMVIPFIRPPQPVDSPKAPPPRKPDTASTTTVLVIGDSLADWLGYGLEEALSDTPEMGVVRRIKAASGLTHYEVHGDTFDWSQAIKETLATDKPNVIVVMLGLNDRQPVRERAPAPAHSAQPPQPAQPVTAAGQTGTPAPQNPPVAHDEAQPPSAAAEATEQKPAATATPAAATEAEHAVPGASYEFHTDKWAELYSKRIDEMIAVLRTKGVPVLWVGLPAIRGNRATTDMSYLDELYRARAEKAGITYVDVWDGFVDEGGHFTMQGPDFEGQIRRLRASDGIHFTKAGAVKLAGYVTQELRRVISTHITPVALPGPEEQPAGKPGVAGPRPAVGPVVPLSATGAAGGALLGAGQPSQAPTDPVATRVLTRGDAAAPAAGRADDFSWPHVDASANAAPVAEPPPAPQPAPPPAAPAASAVKAPAGKNDANKSDVKKPADAKSQPAPDAAAAKSRRSRADLDAGTPRPPLPVGGGNSYAR